MIYLVFTRDGLDEAIADIIKHQATLWTTKNTLSEQHQLTLVQADIGVNYVLDDVDPQNEKSVISAIQYVEQQTQTSEILVEFL